MFRWWWIAALVFAVHPVCVESVAWISEQKNTLSAVFYLLATLGYLRWRGSDAEPRGPWGLYLSASLLFILALLSKSVTATLPAALLVVLWWRRGRLFWKGDIVPLLPWLAVGLVSGLFTAWVERTFIIGAESAPFDLTILQRGLLAGRVFWFYLGKLFWPVNLAFIYPRWRIDPTAGWSWVFPVCALALVAGLWALRRRTRGPLACVLIFAGTLLPALGFFNAYPFVFSYVADHFQYLASLAIIAGVCSAAKPLFARWSAPSGRAGLGPSFRFLQAGALSAIGVLAVLTFMQCGIYRDNETLYRATLRRNPQCVMARNNLGKLLRESGRVAEAVEQYEAALRVGPDAEVSYNLGVAFLSAGRSADAVPEFTEAIRIRPDYPEAHVNLAHALAALGRFAEAITHDEEALRLQPSSSEGRKPDEAARRLNAAEAHENLGAIAVAQGRLGDALGQFQAALGALPGHPAAHNGMGAVLARVGRLDEAILHYQAALRTRPDYAEAHVNLAIAFARNSRFEESIAHFKAALRLQPDLPVVHFDLGSALAQAGRGSEAIFELREALRLKPDFPQARAALERLEKRRDLGRVPPL